MPQSARSPTGWLGDIGQMGQVIGNSCLMNYPCRGVAKLVKALDFDSSMRRFESFFPCQNFYGVFV